MKELQKSCKRVAKEFIVGIFKLVGVKKRRDIQIFIYGHKPLEYGYWDNLLYTPLEVGAALRDKPLFPKRDNTGDNISAWNGIYCETTGQYWIWTNVAQCSDNRLKYIGHCQYRRRLQFYELADFNRLFKRYDVIVAEPYRLDMTVEQHYAKCHYVQDIVFAEQIVKDMYPEYSNDWDSFIKSDNVLYYSTACVMLKNDYLKYSEWLFSIFEEYRRRKGWSCPDDVLRYVNNNIVFNGHSETRQLKYHALIFGFLHERLMTLFIRHNFKKILEVPYTKYEGC